MSRGGALREQSRLSGEEWRRDSDAAMDARSTETGGRFDSDVVTVVTETQTVDLAPRVRVQIRSLADTPTAMTREAAVQARVGVPDES